MFLQADGESIVFVGNAVAPIQGHVSGSLLLWRTAVHHNVVLIVVVIVKDRICAFQHPIAVRWFLVGNTLSALSDEDGGLRRCCGIQRSGVQLGVAGGKEGAAAFGKCRCHLGSEIQLGLAAAAAELLGLDGLHGYYYFRGFVRVGTGASAAGGKAGGSGGHGGFWIGIKGYVIVVVVIVIVVVVVGGFEIEIFNFVWDMERAGKSENVT